MDIFSNALSTAKDAATKVAGDLKKIEEDALTKIHEMSKSMTADSAEAEKSKSESETAEGEGDKAPESKGMTDSARDLLSSAIGAAKQVGGKLTENVGTLNIVEDFQRQQQSFVEDHKAGEQGLGVAPWVGYDGEEEIKRKILALSNDKRNFVRNPPSGVTFPFDVNFYAVAQEILKEDENLHKMRYELVPKQVNEEAFWRNYFYRVSLITQSSHLESIAAEAKSNGNENAGVKIAPRPAGDLDDLTPTDASKFVSDAYSKSKPGGGEKKPTPVTSDDDWERELQKDLNDYEVVAATTSPSEKEEQELEAELEKMDDKKAS